MSFQMRVMGDVSSMQSRVAGRLSALVLLRLEQDGPLRKTISAG